MIQRFINYILYCKVLFTNPVYYDEGVEERTEDVFFICTMSIVSAFTIFSSGIVTYKLINDSYILIFCVCGGILYLLPILLYYLGKYQVAKYCFFVTADICIFHNASYYGFHSQAYIFLLFVVFGVLFIGDNKLIVSSILIGIVVILFTILHLTHFSLFRQDKITLEVSEKMAIKHSISAMVYSVFIVFFIFNRYRKKYATMCGVNELLLDKYSEAEKINKELDRFVHSVSHDLRAPIATCMGLLEISKIENDSNQLKYYLSLHEKSLIRMDDFIREILDFSLNKRTQVIYERVDCEKIIDQIREDLQPDIKNSHNPVQMEIFIEEEQPLYSDAIRLTFLLKNLLSNAFKYRKNNHPGSLIKTHVKVSPNLLEIIVWDNGTGIEPEKLPYIFDMFYRGDVRSLGSGLGLYIAKEVVERLGGSIKVRSEVDIFTEFLVTIPIQTAPATTQN